MKLVLYSGGQSKSNHLLHREVVRLARLGRKKKGPLMFTYVPFCADGAEVFFNRMMRRFRGFGVECFYCLPVDQFPLREEIKLAMESDIIYLAGGNTFYFLKYLRQSGMLEELKKFAKRGGVIAGLSAGGLIMSPTTRLAAEPSLGPDENEVGLKDYKGMGLFSFEFSPHFGGTRKEIEAHRQYSKKTKFPVYAAPDGSGLVIHNDTLTFFGSAELYVNGVRTHFFSSKAS